MSISIVCFACRDHLSITSCVPPIVLIWPQTASSSPTCRRKPQVFLALLWPPCRRLGHRTRPRAFAFKAPVRCPRVTAFMRSCDDRNACDPSLSSGEVGLLYHQLELMGVHCWRDMNADDLTSGGMRRGVQDSDCFLLILSNKVSSSFLMADRQTACPLRLQGCTLAAYPTSWSHALSPTPRSSRARSA